MGAHAEARLDHKLIGLIKQVNLYLNHFPRHEKYGLAQQIRNCAYDVYGYVVESQKRFHKKTSLSTLWWEDFLGLTGSVTARSPVHPYLILARIVGRGMPVRFDHSLTVAETPLHSITMLCCMGGVVNAFSYDQPSLYILCRVMSKPISRMRHQSVRVWRWPSNSMSLPTSLVTASEGLQPCLIIRWFMTDAGIPVSRLHSADVRVTPNAVISVFPRRLFA